VLLSWTKAIAVEQDAGMTTVPSGRSQLVRLRQGLRRQSQWTPLKPGRQMRCICSSQHQERISPWNRMETVTMGAFKFPTISRDLRTSNSDCLWHLLTARQKGVLAQNFPSAIIRRAQKVSNAFSARAATETGIMQLRMISR
jgi:hypothetical protein